MAEARSVVKMPELIVYIKAFMVGVIGAEIFRVSYYSGSNLAVKLTGFTLLPIAIGIIFIVGVCALYAWGRGACAATARLGKSMRIDLLGALLVGVWSNFLIEPFLRPGHDVVEKSNAYWASVVLTMLVLMLISSLIRGYLLSLVRRDTQGYFLADEEIREASQDVFTSDDRTKAFADTVMASGAHASLVFGVDGPWGVGKTSFINLAQQHWEKNNKDSAIVFRFESLRYASEPDLAVRFIRELSAVIQKQVFVPEFKPFASRYSRIIKGKADFSFLGFKLSLEPAVDTIDDLLEDIDDVLKRAGKRVVIVIDDLDRLEAATVNNVFFTVRRTFNLSQATYILCYDTENLIRGASDGQKAREFLEKFVMVKISLFVDVQYIKRYLDFDWKSQGANVVSVPADSMLKLGSILSTLADLLDGESVADYKPLIGDLRKVKRFVNSLIVMQLERIDWVATDFDSRDIVNLVLIYLNYPAVFRDVYNEEAEGRLGFFGVVRGAKQAGYANHKKFGDYLGGVTEPSAKFLLKQLFCVESLGYGTYQQADEDAIKTRACFNSRENRNLDKYLSLIVHLSQPEPRKTYILYKDAVTRVASGKSVGVVLEERVFALADGEHAQEQFWRVLTNQSQNLSRPIAGEAINTLVDYLPKYSWLDFFELSLRPRSIFTLGSLLDRAGWGEPNRTDNNAEKIVEIARRIYGEGEYEGKGLIDRLVSPERGVLGWNDLMMFRLICCADRKGQLHNLQSALILHQDINAATTGPVEYLAVEGMRYLSQEVFSRFKRRYIDSGLNFFDEVDLVPDVDFLGEAANHYDSEYVQANPGSRPLTDRVAATRSSVKTFISYQLANLERGRGSGVGCGVYDECGKGDSADIAEITNRYIFEVCFCPVLSPKNAYHFIDYCLANLTNDFYSMIAGRGYIPTSKGLSGGLSPIQMGLYWRRNRECIMDMGLTGVERNVITVNYTATYAAKLEEVYKVLDELTEGAV
ncbi:P-loop NTPase fold protein [Pseudomonas caspiana]|uniref:P-loop NTPase fold protein n=1 Tax=Pseudomonas caspiana TaxID=1451454 RepID=UPI0032EFD7B5